MAGTADFLSSIGPLALAPLVAFGGDALLASRDERIRNFWVDALTIAEATILSVDVGAAVGGAFGVGMPLLFHRPRAANVAEAPSLRLAIGSQVGVGGTW